MLRRKHVALGLGAFVGVLLLLILLPYLFRGPIERRFKAELTSASRPG
jgi:hypothetical protein